MMVNTSAICIWKIGLSLTWGDEEDNMGKIIFIDDYFCINQILTYIQLYYIYI